MALRLRYVVIVAAAIIAGALGIATHRAYWPAFNALPVTANGAFQLVADNADNPQPFGPSVREWRSSHGAGVLEIGPFTAAHRLRIGVTGRVAASGNQIFVERNDTHARQAVAAPDLGNRWAVIDVRLPDDWKGHPVTLNAIAGPSESAVEFGVSEPLRGGLGDGNGALYLSLTAWLLNGVLLWFVWATAVQLVTRRGWIAEPWIALVAAGMVAAAGYLLFWAYFASPVLGRIGSGALVLGSAVSVVRSRRITSQGTATAEVPTVALLMVTIGFFYLTLLHLFPSSLNFYELTANRFRPDLPADNSLTRDLARGLWYEENLRPLGAEWQTSDRPPLQGGWQLIALPFTQVLGLDFDAATGTAAFWLQLLWIPAAYGLMRALGLTRRRATAWTVVVSLTGFCVQNTVYTWAKMPGGAFACGAFALWALPGTGQRTRSHYALGAMLAGLGWMSHGAVAFSLIPLAPWVVWRSWRGELRGWLLAAAVFLMFALSWVGFQKLYNPPGDRLIKWHLGGHIAPDPRGTWTVIREGYHQKTWAEIIYNKRTNFQYQVLATWPALFDFNPEHAELRRNNEFFSTFRALTWWLAAPLVLGGTLLLNRTTRRHTALATNGGSFHPTFPSPAFDTRGLLAWTLATLVVWCLLIFGPWGAFIHTGSYAPILALFVIGSVWLDRASRWWIIPIAALQIATLVTTWALPNERIGGSPAAWPLLALGSLALAAVWSWARLTGGRA